MAYRNQWLPELTVSDKEAPDKLGPLLGLRIARISLEFPLSHLFGAFEPEKGGEGHPFLYNNLDV